MDCCLERGVVVVPGGAAVATAARVGGGVGRRVRERVGVGGGRRVVVASPDVEGARGVAMVMWCEREGWDGMGGEVCDDGSVQSLKV
jgi:hypothetical protein